ncbi:MAG: MFS transporter, partial [Nonomuraea sp.]|nr:MFS transporter [Nonomuraea sp.]
MLPQDFCGYNTELTDGVSSMKRLLLVVLCGAIFLEGIDIGMLNVALPSIRADLGLETAELSWVVGGYVLGYAGFMLLGGRAADLLGRRRMFLLWLAVFIAFSGLGGFATESWMLILARFVTGVASAFMTPAGLSIITTAFPEGPRRDRVLMIYAATGAGGFSLGLVAGGVLASANWRLVFFAPVVLAALILLGAIPLTPRDRRPEAGGRFDVLGAVTITAAMVLLALGVTRLEHGLGPVPLAAFAGGALSLAAFVAVERRAAHPLVRLAVLRNPGLLRADLTAMLLAG